MKGEVPLSAQSAEVFKRRRAKGFGRLGRKVGSFKVQGAKRPPNGNLDDGHLALPLNQPVKVLFESADASLRNLITKYTPVYINNVNRF